MDPRYFDHNATTPPSKEVLNRHQAVLRDVFGNASSIHQRGQEASHVLETAREQIAALAGADPDNVVITSGGTEADNTVVLGILRRADPAHVITTAIEHPAVLGSCAVLEQAGVDVTRIPVGSSGVVDPDDVRGALRPHTALISVMHANNETGTIQPVREIAAISREAGVPFHTDGVQAFGRIAVDIDSTGIDYYAISAHKIYAPKGVGALILRSGASCAPLLHGGRHQRGRRAGTENVPGAAAMGEAVRWLAEHGPAEWRRVATLRDRLERAIVERIPAAKINCGQSPRLPNTSSVTFEGIEGEAVVIGLDLEGFSVSSGAACSSGSVEPSHVLLAIGLSPREARSSVRYSLGRPNTQESVDELVDATERVVARLRAFSTDWVAHA